MSGAEVAFPDEVGRLFWDVDHQAVDLKRHCDYVMERFMSRGGWAAMTWLRRVYSKEEMADFLERKGRSRLAPRELAYWSLIAGVDLPVARGGGRPLWAGS